MRNRHGFTLVEMLVSLALILFIMAILSEAFVTGLEAFRRLKGIGDMNDKLRTAATALRRDLRAVRFSDSEASGKRLSQVMLPPTTGFFRLWQAGPAIPEGTDPYSVPSTVATNHMLHFSIDLRATPDPLGDRRERYLSAAVGALSPLALPPYTLPAFQDANPLTGYGNYYSQTAEVAWFLRPLTTPGGVPITAAGTQLYGLFRRQLLTVPNNSALNTLLVQPSALLDPNSAEAATWSYYVPPPGRATLLPNYVEVSCKVNPQNPGVLYFNSPKDLTIPVRRFGMVPTPNPTNALQPENAGLLSNGTFPNAGYWINGTYPKFSDDVALQSLWGADLILSNVISFDVKLAFDETNGDFVDLWGFTGDPTKPPYALPMLNPAFGLPGQPRVFDTWSSYSDGYYNYSVWQTPGTTLSMPLPLNPRALQIILRVYDEKSQAARQITIVQDM